MEADSSFIAAGHCKVLDAPEGEVYFELKIQRGNLIYINLAVVIPSKD